MNENIPDLKGSFTQFTRDGLVPLPRVGQVIAFFVSLVSVEVLKKVDKQDEREGWKLVQLLVAAFNNLCLTVQETKRCDSHGPEGVAGLASVAPRGNKRPRFITCDECNVDHLWIKALEPAFGANYSESIRTGDPDFSKHYYWMGPVFWLGSEEPHVQFELIMTSDRKLSIAVEKMPNRSSLIVTEASGGDSDSE